MRIGEVLAGRYRLDAPLADSGLGSAAVATDLTRGTQVRVLLPAMRIRLPEAGTTPRRAVVGAHVAAVQDTGTAGDGRPFIVTPLVHGVTLHDARAAGPLPYRGVLAMAAAVADGLVAAHAEGVMHRAIRPGVIVVPPTGPSAAVLTDVGVADALGAPGAARYARVFGTTAYLSPEQRQQGIVGPATDVYALGVLLTETLTGRAVPPGGPRRDTMLRPEDAGLPQPLRRLLAAATHPDRAERPGAGELASALRAEATRTRAHRATGSHVAGRAEPVPPTTASVPIPVVVPAPVAAVEAVTGPVGALVAPGGRRVAFAVSGAFAAAVLIGLAAFLPAAGADRREAGRTEAAAAAAASSSRDASSSARSAGVDAVGASAPTGASSAAVRHGSSASPSSSSRASASRTTPGSSASASSSARSAAATGHLVRPDGTRGVLTMPAPPAGGGSAQSGGSSTSDTPVQSGSNDTASSAPASDPPSSDPASSAPATQAGGSASPDAGSSAAASTDGGSASPSSSTASDGGADGPGADATE